MSARSDLHLFLANEDTGTPALPAGLARASLGALPRLHAMPLPRVRCGIRGASADSLQEQRWGIVAPRGSAGDRLLSWARGLREKRERDQDYEAQIYRVDPGMSAADSARWMDGPRRRELPHPEDEPPGYLLLLGGPELLSWELQQMLATDAFVGRLCFDAEAEIHADTAKLTESESGPATGSARTVFYTVRDGSPATEEGYRGLMRPCFEQALALSTRSFARFPVDAERIVEIGGGESVTKREALAQAERVRAEAQAPATILFSLSHGLGAPRAGWSSPAEQRALQGAMQTIGRGGRLTAADLASMDAYLPGGAWLFYACFSAGTPGQSAYLTWLSQLHDLGQYTDPRDEVLRSLPGDGQGFAAALPNAALAHPRGPLGVIGHVDLAWSWSFLDSEGLGSQAPAESRADRLRRVIQSLAQGHRFGVALWDLGAAFSTATHQLVTMFEARERRADPSESDAEKRERADLWMRRQDLGAHVLLGDPAARLALTRPPRRDDKPNSLGSPDPSS